MTRTMTQITAQTMTRTLSATALVATIAVLIGACAHGEHRDHAQTPPADYQAGEPEPLPAPHHAPATDPQPAPAQAEAQAGAEPVDPEPMPADPPPAEEPDTYTVREGDTLWSIAEQVYGDGHKWEDIVRANPGLQPEGLRVGQEIILP